MTIHAFDPNDESKEIGTLNLMKRRGGYWVAAGVGVDKDYRRRGVATAMYDEAEKLGIEIKPSDLSQTADAEAFWANRRRKPPKLPPTKLGR